MTTSPVITRFAPSPTGYLHIGGARTALFNWLFARHHKGKFLLRIEDTDRARHNEEAVNAILEGLAWLGLDADEAPISQYERRKRHTDVALQLLEKGHAYRCYLTPEELDSLRDKARAENTRFESPWRTRPPEQAPTDTPFVVRFRAPQEGQTIVHDGVQSDVTFPNDALDDLVILRSADIATLGANTHGEPTYNLAVVVDDHDMGVTHIIRGDDHLINAARQQQIYEALGWPVPVFAHIPLIHGPDGKKLSKRHGALGIEAYRDQGYLPDGLANYLLRLGWSHGDEEIISRDRAIELFELSGINKSPARLDLEKLDHVNGVYMKTLTDEAFIDWATPFITQAGHSLTSDQSQQLLRAAPFLKERCANLCEVPAQAGFILMSLPFEITGKAAKPLRKEGAGQTLNSVIKRLETHADWLDESALEALLQAFADEKGVGFGQIGPPVRAALTAGNPSPGIGTVLRILGKNEALARLHASLMHPDLA